LIEWEAFMARNGRYAHIVGWGMYVPEHRRTNDEIATMVDTSDEWIVSRTGIKERRIAADHESTATMAIRAAEAALVVANMDPEELDLIIVASATPDHLFPATACLVQDDLGADRAGAFDLSAACSGFIYGVSLAAQAIKTGAIDTALIIGSETLSRVVDWNDRQTCILFGDGAGAVILTARKERGGVLSSTMRADGSGSALLALPAGGSRYPASLETLANNQHTIKMQGREVFRFATRVMADATRVVTEKAGLTLDDVSLIIPHQANTRIIQTATRRLKFPGDRVFINVDRYGNTSSASVPIALCEAIEAGRVQSGDNLVLVGFGAGLTWAAAVIQWAALWPVTPQPTQQRLLRRIRRGFARFRSAWRRFRRRIWGALGWIQEEGEDQLQGLRDDLPPHDQ
jgi:3-oxoacyl-[acyl-carrier-protein] synthase-3